MPLFTSKKFLPDIEAEQRKRVSNLSEQPWISFMLAAGATEGNSIEYAEKKVAHAQRIGARAILRIVPQAEMPKFLRLDAKNPKVKGMMFHVPLPNRSQQAEFAAMIPASKDVDRMRPDTPEEVPTSWASRKILELNGIALQGTVAINGWGTVGKSLQQQLALRGISPILIDRKFYDSDEKTAAELRRAMIESDFVFSYAPVADVITPEMVLDSRDGRPITIVDVGIGSREDGTSGGNVRPDVLELESDLVRVAKGVGALTKAKVFYNFIENAEILQGVPA